MASSANMLLQSLWVWGLLLPSSFGFLGPADVVSVARRQMETLPADMAQPEPSCAQLRAMWRHMHRMARHSQVTNEIPQFPAAYPFGFVSPDSQPKVFYASRSPPSRSAFGRIVQKPSGNKGRSRVNPGYPDAGRRQSARVPPRPLGRFGDSPMPRSTLGMYGTLVRSPEEKAQLRRKQSADAYGSWGRIVPAQQPVRQIFHAVAADASDPLSENLNKKQEWCRRTVLNQPCNTHQDCFCSRSKYYCSAGRCRASVVRKTTDPWGTWYEGPLESSRLGARPVPGSALDFPLSNNI